MKNEIKIEFTDFWRGFDKKNNMFINLLQKKYNIILSDSPDFLIYSCFGSKHLQYLDCVKIFYTGEVITPDFNECDYAIGFDYIKFENRYIRQPRGVIYNHQKKQNLPIELAQRKFCNFIYSNSSIGEGAQIRQIFYKKLCTYKHIDCPGIVFNNMKNAIEPRDGDWVKGKLDFIKNYKFTIAFENASKIGYITEKLKQPLEVDSIPIYWGDPEVTREFNPKAFINCHDFKNFNEVIEYIKFLDNNDTAYMKMLYQHPMQENYIYNPQEIENFLYSIIEKGNNPLPKDPLNIRDTKKQKIKYLLQECCLLECQLGNLDKAEKYIQEALALQNTLLWPYEKLLFIYKKKNNKHKIIEIISSIIKIDLKNIQFHRALAKKLIDDKYYDEAEIMSHYVLNKDPNLSWPYEILCYIHSARGESNMAIEKIQKAIDLDPKNSFLIHHKACLLRINDKLDEAEQLTNQAISIYPHPEMYWTLSHIYLTRKNYKKSILFAVKSLELDKNNLRYKNHFTVLVKILINNKNFNIIENICNQALLKNSELSWPYEALSRVQTAEKKYDIAIESIQKAIDLDPKNAYLIHHKACLLRTKGNIDEAEKYTNKALSIIQHPQMYMTLSLIHLQRNNYNDALIFAKKSLELNPKEKIFQDHLLYIEKLIKKNSDIKYIL